MKKLMALVFTFFLTACSDGGFTQGDGTLTPLLPSADSVSASSSAPHERVLPSMPPPVSAAPGTAAPPDAEDADSDQTEGIATISVDIVATNAYVVNVDTDTVLYQKNSDEYIAPASTAKMLTALTVLDYCELEDTVTVGSEISLIAADSSTAWLNYGDKLTVRQLLVALLLPSGNDAAYTLAVTAGRRIAGDDGLSMQQAVEAFVEAMNQKARDVGAASSNFVTPDGYDADGQHTTACDLAQIAKVCLSNDTLSEIMGSYRIYDTWVNGREVTYFNTNKLLDPGSAYYYSNCVGLKTGTSENAGSCLVSAAAINGLKYICVVMGNFEETRFTDSLTIYNEIEPVLSLPLKDTAPLTPPGERMGERMRH